MADKPIPCWTSGRPDKTGRLPKDGLFGCRPIARCLARSGCRGQALHPSMKSRRWRVLLSRIDALTEGNKTRPIVTFCKPKCRGSWNAGKRLVVKGYTGVGWFPAGIDGWQETRDSRGQARSWLGAAQIGRRNR